MNSASVVAPLSGVELTHLTYALVVVTVFFGLSSLYLAVRLHRLNQLYKKMMQGANGESMENMMLARIQDIEVLKQAARKLDSECVRLDTESRRHIQKIGVVRFNAFDNTGSDLSFSLALLDAADNGFVLSGIYGREDSRVYAKPLVKGESTYMLTKEEKQALEEARKK